MTVMIRLILINLNRTGGFVFVFVIFQRVTNNSSESTFEKDPCLTTSLFLSLFLQDPSTYIMSNINNFDDNFSEVSSIGVLSGSGQDVPCRVQQHQWGRVHL
jgi:hypothetical protein